MIHSLLNSVIDPQGPSVYFKDDFRSAVSSCRFPEGGELECLPGQHCRKPEVKMPSCQQPKTSSKADNTVQCQVCVRMPIKAPFANTRLLHSSSTQIEESCCSSFAE